MFEDFMWQKFSVSGDVCDYLVYVEETGGGPVSEDSRVAGM